MSGTHTKMSPSSFARRIACPGSLGAEADLPDSQSPYAAEGTGVHEVAEVCLKGAHDANEMLGRRFNGFECDMDMADAVQVYLDYVRSLEVKHRKARPRDAVTWPPFDYEIETRLELPFLGEGEKGTADFGCLHGTILEIVDYKHGKGVAVEAVENPQGICYGLGFAAKRHNQPWDTLRITIAQPRAPHPEGPIRSWDIPRDDVIDYLLSYSAAAEAARAPDAPRFAGPHCRFCKANAICETLRDFSLSEAEETFAVVAYDGQTLANALAKVPTVELWAKAVKDRAMAEANAGRTPPGWKLVATRATRKWKDESTAKSALEQYGLDDGDLYERSFKSPAKIEKVVGKKPFAADLAGDLVESVSSGMTLAPVDDPRPSVRASAEETFGSVED